LAIPNLTTHGEPEWVSRHHTSSRDAASRPNPHTTGCSLDIVQAVKQSGARGGHNTHCTSSYSGTSARHDGPFLFPTQFLRGLDEVRAKCRSTGGDERRWRRQRCHVFFALSLLFSACTQPGAACLDFHTAMCIISSTFRIVPAFALLPHGVPAYGSF